MIKELDRQQQKFLQWEGVERVSALSADFKRCATTLIAALPRLGEALRGDRRRAPAAIPIPGKLLWFWPAASAA